MGPTCEQPMGTVWTGPKTCDKRAKWVAHLPWESLPRLVCGIHRRSLLRWSGVTVEERIPEEPF